MAPDSGWTANNSTLAINIVEENNEKLKQHQNFTSRVLGHYFKDRSSNLSVCEKKNGCTTMASATSAWTFRNYMQRFLGVDKLEDYTGEQQFCCLGY